ncbi:MAG: hypothetical protein ACYDAZ_08855 [Thermoplasmataceae archaeon]
MAEKKDDGLNLARYSFEDLRYIFKWSTENNSYRSGDLILIGGWAVHSFYPWKYSLDIDFIATNRFKDLLKRHLYSFRGYNKKEKDSYGNTIPSKATSAGNIYLDFLPKRDLFHGTNKILDLKLIDYQTITQSISYASDSGFQVAVPEISLLFVLKLKAAWDRHHDLVVRSSSDMERLTEKFNKDCGDLIALLRSEAFQFARIDWLSFILSKFDFLKKFLEQGIVEDNSAFDRLSHKESETLIKKLLSLI